MKRNKAAVLKSGIDPELRRLRKLQAIKSTQEKKYVQALESIEFYWEQVFDAIDKEQVVA
jgi:hypothetical protein